MADGRESASPRRRAIPAAACPRRRRLPPAKARRAAKAVLVDDGRTGDLPLGLNADALAATPAALPGVKLALIPRPAVARWTTRH